MNRYDWRVFEVAREQQGVVSYAQVTELGVPESALRWRLKTGEWVRVLPSVARMYWAEETWLLRARAALLWLGGEGALSHLSAATLLGLAVGNTKTVEVAVPEGLWQGSVEKWLVVHKSRGMTVVQLNEFRVTSLGQTFVDVAGVVGERQLELVVKDAVARKLVTLSVLGAVVAQRRRGRPGLKRLREVVERLVRAQKKV